MPTHSGTEWTSLTSHGSIKPALSQKTRHFFWSGCSEEAGLHCTNAVVCADGRLLRVSMESRASIAAGASRKQGNESIYQNVGIGYESHGTNETHHVVIVKNHTTSQSHNNIQQMIRCTS